jgi:putative transposase
MVAEVMTTHALSQRRACGLIGITRRGFQRAPAEDRNHQLRQRLRELAEQRRRWGCPMLYLMLRREGWRANHKRVERLYREEGLSLRRRRRRKRLSHLRVVRERPVAANQTWVVDFIHDSLISGRRFRAFAVLDQWSRESLAIEVDVSLTGERVTRVLERLHTVRGLPGVIQAEMVPNCAAGCSTSGPMIMACGCSSSNRASRSRTRTSRASTRGCARNASTSTFSFRSTMRAARSKRGVSNTIGNAPI